MLTQEYKKPFFIALALHVFLLILSILHFSEPYQMQSNAEPSSASPMEAVMVQELPQKPKYQKPIEKPKLVEKEKERDLKEIIEKENALALKKEALEAAKAEKKLKLAEEKKAAAEKILLKKAEMEKTKKADLAKKAEIAKVAAEKVAAEKVAAEKAEAKKIALAEKKAEAEKAAAEKEKAEKKRERLAALERELALEHQSTQAVDHSELDRIKNLILESIGRQWILPEDIDRSLACKLEIRVAPGGNVISVKLINSSGDLLLDRSAEAAVYKASPLPIPGEAAVFNHFRVFLLTVRPEKIVST